jgi:hypothetical protein
MQHKNVGVIGVVLHNWHSFELLVSGSICTAVCYWALLGSDITINVVDSSFCHLQCTGVEFLRFGRTTVQYVYIQSYGDFLHEIVNDLAENGIRGSVKKRFLSGHVMVLLP